MTTTLLWLFVICLGTTFGAGLYESQITVPRWLASNRWDAEAARSDDPGRRFWAFVTTGPLTLLAILGVVLAWRAAGELRTWWLAAAITALAERIITFGYFIPAMVRLLRLPDSAEALRAAQRWSRINYARHVLILTAWLLALQAFAVLDAGRR